MPFSLCGGGHATVSSKKAEAAAPQRASSWRMPGARRTSPLEGSRCTSYTTAHHGLDSRSPIGKRESHTAQVEYDDEEEEDGDATTTTTQYKGRLLFDNSDAHRRLAPAHRQRAPPPSPLPSALGPNLVGQTLRSPSMPLSPSCGHTSKTEPQAFFSSVSGSNVSALRPDRLQPPSLSVADVCAPAEKVDCEPSGETDQQHQPRQQEQRASHCRSPRAQNCTSTCVSAVEAGAMQLFSGVETPTARTSRASVHFVFGGDGEGDLLVRALPGACLVTPREDASHDAETHRRSRSGSLCSVTLPPPLEAHGTLLDPSDGQEENRAGKRAFVPLCFHAGAEQPCVTDRGSDGGVPLVAAAAARTSASLTSVLTPTSILLKSSTLLSASSNGATMANGNQPSWHSSRLSGRRLSCRGSRQDASECRAATPVRRRSSPPVARFIEDGGVQHQLSRRSTSTTSTCSSSSSSSDDAHTAERVRLMLRRRQRRDSGARNVNGQQLLKVMRVVAARSAKAQREE